MSGKRNPWGDKQERNRQIIACLLEGGTQKDVAKAFGLSTATIQYAWDRWIYCGRPSPYLAETKK